MRRRTPCRSAWAPGRSAAPGRAARRLVARPRTRQLLERPRSAPVDGRLHEAEDRALEQGGRKELPPAVFAFLRLRRVLLVRPDLPEPFEEHAGEHAAENAEDQSEGPVDQLRHGRRIPAGPTGKRATGPPPPEEAPWTRAVPRAARQGR